jgi:inhibitor of cysteine peptidase
MSTKLPSKNTDSDLFTEVLNQNQKYKIKRFFAYFRHFFKSKTWFKSPRFWLLTTSMTTVLIFVVLIFTDLNLHKKENSVFMPIKGYALEKFDSCEEIGNKFNEYYDYQKSQNQKKGRSGVDYSIVSSRPDMMDLRNDSTMENKDVQYSGGKGSSNQSDFSTTNNQVKNVDEGDLVKTDGTYIYSITPNTRKLNISYFKDGVLSTRNELQFDYDFYPKKLQLSSDYKVLMVIGGDSQKTKVKIYRTSDLTSPVENTYIGPASDWTFGGGIKESRFVDNKLILITNLNNNYVYARDGNQRLKTVKESLPGISEVHSKFGMTDCKNIQYISPLPSIQTYTSVYTLNFAKGDFPKVSQNTVVSGNQITYMSEKNLYLAQPHYEDSRMIDRFKYQTTIYKFNLTDTGLKYQTRGRVDGNLLNQFSMDEYENNLRVATTVSKEVVAIAISKMSDVKCSAVDLCGQPSGVERVGNFITILNDKMELRARTQSLAKGERIYAVRFLGDKGYMVTFRQTDPLYTFDLTDPNNPRVTGELKIPGFSNYLHPINDGYLIGVGKNSANGSVKISLFDVRDQQNPKEVDMKEIGGSGSNTPVDDDHKAFLWDQRNQLLTLPITVNDNNYNMTYQGSYVYKVNLESGFELDTRISHIDYELLKQENITKVISDNSKPILNDKGEVVGQGKDRDTIITPNPYINDAQNYYILRQMYMDNYLLTISSKMIQSHTIGNYTKTGEINFD